MSSNSKYTIVLKPIGNDKLLPINVSADKVTIVGRTAEFRIEDVLCSRKQIQVEVDAKKPIIHLTNLGINPSSINDKIMERGKVYEAKNGDILQVIHTRLDYRVCIITNDEKSIKRPADEMAQSSDLKRAKCETNPETTSLWESYDNGKLLIFTSKGVVGRKKIASYDLDGTIITTQSGKVFPKDVNDWKIAYSEVPGALKKNIADEYKVVFFTNQAGISKGKCTVEEFKKKIEAIILKLKVPVQCFVSTSDGNRYRKPLCGMWETLYERNQNVKISRNVSFYVGDAAGRPEQKNPKRKKDFSCSDRLMAINVGLQFYTPEEYFQSKKTEPFVMPAFKPTQEYPTNLLEPRIAKLKANELEVIVMVGAPASGKSNFAKHHIAPLNYKIINRDELKTGKKCLDVLGACLKKKQSAIIDNTNGNREARLQYIKLATQYKVPCRCFVMNTTIKHAMHNNIFRELTDISHAKVPALTFNIYKSKFEEPKLEEGFQEIVRVNFIPKFANEPLEKLYKLYHLSS